ncbi:hypothetical protein BUALT_Bualt06G0072200 [Buddleja alternifolia]|uniref:Transposase n=1 Tax=Buddleja alternifolia TaxID=168488 RepID=A0AAV6XL95_9LAMI|nr:hypothetical protein BUALT_Bualt06G0072200 [Buddleja alternifolia]
MGVRRGGAVDFDYYNDQVGVETNPPIAKKGKEKGKSKVTEAGTEKGGGNNGRQGKKSGRGKCRQGEKNVAAKGKKVAEASTDKGKKTEKAKGKEKVIDKGKEKVGGSSTDKGKRKVSDALRDDEEDSRSEYDDSSDSDYVHPAYESDELSSVGSDAPSILLGDLEDSSDDDIFKEKNPTKKQLLEKLKKMMESSKSQGPGPSTQTQNNVDSENEAAEKWYSDPGDDDDDIDNLDSAEEGMHKFPFFREGSKVKHWTPAVGIKFKNAKVYREVLRDYYVRNGYDLTFIRNDFKRITTKCKVESCKWRIRASPIQGGTTFQIKTLSGVHTCAKSYVYNLAKAKYIGLRMKNVVRDNPNIPISKLKDIIKRKCNVDATKWKVIRVKKAARDRVNGEDILQYRKLWDYCETVRARNPASKILLRRAEGVEPPTFEKMYYSLHAMKMGFLAGCRPIIGLDGCFLKTAYCGQLLVAVGRDGNDNMWPIAIRLVQVENTENWKWFLSELFEDIGHVRGLVFMTDRQKGLVEAVKTLAPDSEHRYCVRLMYQNFKAKWKDEKLKELVWRAASSATKSDFQMYMQKIEVADPKVKEDVKTAVEWLREVPQEHWCRAYFSTHCKSEILVNNLYESFNNYILDARDKPIITMFEMIRVKLMKRIQEKKAGMEKYNGNVCPVIMARVNANGRMAKNCFPTWCGDNEHEVEQFLDKYDVDLDKKTCSCGMFQLCG